MIASLDELYHSELFFLPVMDENARLVGLEIIVSTFLFSINLLHGLIYRLQLVTYYY